MSPMKFCERFLLRKSTEIVKLIAYLEAYMKGNSDLTTEDLRKKFKNNFDLCNFSINLARNVILEGQQVTLQEALHLVDDRAGDVREPNAFSV